LDGSRLPTVLEPPFQHFADQAWRAHGDMDVVALEHGAGRVGCVEFTFA
jgi:hypothetical protein